MEDTYPGLHNDKHGLTQLGRIVLDGRLFGLIPDTEDCAGWSGGRMQDLMERVQNEWDQYANLPSRLPPDLRKRHGELYDRAIQTARAKGWDPELGEDE
ncbi:MAG: hypothetical protein RBS28_05005 [Rhodocyclaceae bacterium]|jgi:hypothetical protein|nr:hypothetical protein [Rhodocyclaceae bacterium]